MTNAELTIGTDDQREQRLTEPMPRTTQEIARQSRNPVADYSPHYRAVAAAILSLDPKSVQSMHHRRGIVTTLDYFRGENEEVLSRLEEVTRILLQENRPLLTDHENVVKVKVQKNNERIAQLKYIRFLLASYFAERIWDTHERGALKVPIRYVETTDMNACVDSTLDSLQSDQSYAGRILQCYTNALQECPFTHSPKDHQKIAHKTAIHFSKEFLRIAPLIYRQYLASQNPPRTVQPEDLPIIVELGGSAIPLVERLASVDMKTCLAFVKAGSGFPPPRREEVTDLPQFPEQFCAVQRSENEQQQKWTIEMRPEILQKIQAFPITGLGCPGTYAQARNGKSVIQALCDEQYAHWSAHIVPQMLH